MNMTKQPITHIHCHMGNHRQEVDFSQFWQAAKAEVDALRSDYQISEASFNHPVHKCRELRFSGVNGGQIYAKYVQSSESESSPCPVIFVFHGYGEASPSWSQLMRWASAGFSVFAMDVRGQQGRSMMGEERLARDNFGQLMRGIEQGAQNLHFKRVYQDCYQLVSLVSNMPTIDPSRMYTYGTSQGGALSIVAAVLSQKISKTVSVHPFLADFASVIDMHLTNSPYFEINQYFKFNDAAQTTRETVLSALDYIDVQNFAPLLCNSLLGAVTMQDDVCPPKTQMAVFDKVTSDKNILIYPEHGHEDIKEFEDVAYSYFLQN
ncbi:alpha/beta fold hydrolase [Vibrio sp. WXL103]|uniref:alpha/beta fold hydrolase n=1 Tax=Vibrio sp. WXL103 TaxID=3450710 RepID=UPI003EC70C98